MCISYMSKICLAVYCLSCAFFSNSMNFELDTFIGRGGEYRKSCTIGEDVDRIENSKFEGMRDLDFVQWTGTPREIGDRAFANTGISKMILNEGVVKIGNEVFANCTNLNLVKFPKSIESLGNNVLNFSTVGEIIFPKTWKIFKQKLPENDFECADELYLYVDIGDGKNVPLGFVPCATKLWKNSKPISIKDLPRIQEDFN